MFVKLMSELLLQYHKIHPATWGYLSSLLTIGLFFKFNRLWSVRNFDLFLVILLAPGLLLVQFASEERLEIRHRLLGAGHEVPPVGSVDDLIDGAFERIVSDRNGGDGADGPVVGGADRGARSQLAETKAGEIGQTVAAEPSPISVDGLEWRFARAVINERYGYYWLFGVGAVLLARLLLDPTMVRRPLLEPNLSTGGLAFLGLSLFVFLMANIITSTPTRDDLEGPRSAVQLLARHDVGDHGNSLRRHGPSYAILSILPSIPTIAGDRAASGAEVSGDAGASGDASSYVTAAKAMAIAAHLATIIGIVLIGYRHFGNVQTGIGVAAFYLMLPYTAVMTGRVDHALPAALTVWAVVCYRQPLLAGMCIGLAAGVVYYPLFLLPLWLSFYWRRGLTRFAASVVAMLLLMVLSLALVSADMQSFAEKVRVMFGIFRPRTVGLEGIWGLGWDSVYRIPVLALFVTLSLTLALWPAQKNLGTLLSCSAAVMVSIQFWHGFGGGLYMAWYLPLLLLTVFRPNLEDRVALSVLGEGWFRNSRRAIRTLDQAA
ncbi:MAG: DUF2029 domain-containing protein [Planctomycetes bacterium]|nr:DUF2029 domain-containing protein [Planctomycetota bacterium]